MGRKKKKNNDLQKTGIISLLVIIGALGYINLINGNISLPEAKIEPNINITSTPFYQKIFGAKNQSRVKENILTDVYYAADVVFNPSNRPIALYNASGMLLEQSVEDISLSKYGHGFYFVRLVDTNQTLKLVK